MMERRAFITLLGGVALIATASYTVSISCSRSIRRNREKPAASLGHRSRSSDEASVRGLHQGQQSTRTAGTGRTHDCKRLLCGTRS
jgi:hypothetical protein